VSAEHSRYLTALISLARDWPSAKLTMLRPLEAICCWMELSLRRSDLVPTCAEKEERPG
jgi:hypothetical protein